MGALNAFALGCSAGSTNGGTTSGGPAGGFALQLNEAMAGQQAYASFGGGVKDAVDPRDARQELAKEGACRLTTKVPLTCTPPCTGLDICAGQNRCTPEPTFQPIGTVTVTGLASDVTLMPLGTSNQYNANLMTLPFPPFAAGADIKVAAAGGKYPAFSVSSKGIEKLEFPGNGMKVARNQPLGITWTAPAQAGSAKILAVMDLAHHGGGTARIECEVPDSGSTTIPAALINKLLDLGTAGFSSLTLTRLATSSTNVAGGIVELRVASYVYRDLAIDGVISCTCTLSAADPMCATEGTPCPAGMVCNDAPGPGRLTCM